MDELKAQLREQGIEELSRVRCGYMEGDGRISVVSDEEEQHQKPSSPGHLDAGIEATATLLKPGNEADLPISQSPSHATAGDAMQL